MSRSLSIIGWILGAVGLCLILDQTVITHPLVIPKGSLSERIGERLAVTDGSVSYDVLFLGDSTSSADIDPNLFSTLTGKSAAILSTVSPFNPVSDYVFMKRYLEHHQSPEAFVLLRHVSSVHNDVPASAFFDYFPDIRLTTSLYNKGLLSGLVLLRSFLSSAFPSLRDQGVLRNLVQAHLRNAAGIDGESLICTGALVIKPRTISTPRIDTFPLLTLSLLQSMCTLAGEHNTKLLLTFSPISSVDAQDARTISALRKFQSIDQTIVSSESGCQIFMRDIPSYDNSLMADPSHLNVSGAQQYTTTVAEKYLEQ